MPSRHLRHPALWAVSLIALAIGAMLIIAWSRAKSETAAAVDPDGMRVLAEGLNRPTFAASAPGDSALWVAEQPGRLLRLDDGDTEVVADLTGSILLGSEQGLLGVAFGPDFAASRLLYLHYSDRRGDTTVAEFRVRGDGSARQRRVLLRVAQPYDNHNGGGLAFGPDGRLYLGLGDGGGAYDPGDRAQDTRSKLGKILAADVRSAAKPDWDVVAYGLRNPWRFSFDLAMGHVWIGDVGQDKHEEVNRIRVHERGQRPRNLGWPAFEGNIRRHGRSLRGDGELTRPVAVYSHKLGCSITGGLIHRGRPRHFDNRYVYGDFCSGRIWSLAVGPGERVGKPRLERFRIPQLTHIGTDHDRRLIFVSADGLVRQLAG